MPRSSRRSERKLMARLEKFQVAIANAKEEAYQRHQHQFPAQESHIETKSAQREVDESEDEDDEIDASEDEDDEIDASEHEDDEIDASEDEDEAENYEVEKFMVDGKHFSHSHPLSPTISSEEGDDDEDDLCRICGLPILSSPSYTCTIGCKFFLHQQCALKLPPKLFHPTHRPVFYGRHFLYIGKPSSSPNFTYECEDCDFEIHPLVALALVGGGGVEIKIKHKSHPSHPLVAICKETVCECDACGKIQYGFFFWCHLCNFWIHQDCTILPSVVTLASYPQPFILAYSIPPFPTQGGCVICEKPLLVSHNGVYLCPQFLTFAHVACGSDKRAASKTRLELIQLPDEEWDAFPSLVICRYAESKPLDPKAYDDDDDDDDDDKLTIEKYHNHPLILDHGKACNRLAYCDLCIQPITISSPFYTCTCDDCHFIAHKICADILPILKFFIPFGGQEDGYTAQSYADDLSSCWFNSIFYCRFCHRPCNGICYYIPHLMGEDKSSLFLIDLECMAAPSTTNHASHPQHILFRTHRLTTETPLACCPEDSLFFDVYRCILCDYFIHIRCAMLPKTIVCHECHHHPLHLAFSAAAAAADDGDGLFCEICEKDIDLSNKYWVYGCGECEQWFHVNCIPSVGYLSKVKFGGTLSLPDCHIHPLSLKRMLTLPTQRCGHCHQIIHGLVDEMAFFCSRCHFWLHFSCAAHIISDELMLYSDLDDEAMIREIREELDALLYFPLTT